MEELQEYKVKINRSALADLDELFDYITAEYSKESALEIRQRIKDAIRSLCHLPKRHRTFFMDFRCLTVGKYLILYVVKGQTVTVKAVFHSSMDIISHLNDR